MLSLFLNGERGLRIAEALARVHCEPNLVVIHRCDPSVSERAGQLLPNALQLNVDETSWETVASVIGRSAIDVAIVAGFSRLVPYHLLDLPRLGFVNLHAGPVPKYRGGSPLNWQLINGERKAGVSLLRMTSGIDDGPVVASEEFPIGPSDSIATLHEHAIQAFQRMVIRIVQKPSLVELATPQPTIGAQYWHQRSDADGQILPLLHSAEFGARMVRALEHPYPGAWIRRGDSVLRIRIADIPRVAFRGTPGRVVVVPGLKPVLIMREGAIELRDVHAANGPATLRNGEVISSESSPQLVMHPAPALDREGPWCT